MSDERAGNSAHEPDEGTAEPALPDPRRDPAGALDALEERVLGAPRDRFDEDTRDAAEGDEPDEPDEPGPCPDEPPS
jgi:hypothetical protein